MLKRITLVGEQRKVLTLNHEGPIQIKGAAGSGKTTVAVYRACHLMDTHADMFEPSKVAIFTFGTTLSNYLSTLTHSLNENDYSSMKIINFHKWAFAFILQNGKNLFGKTLFDNQIQSILAQIIRSIPKTTENSRILSKSLDFFTDEISWLKGKLINSKDEYISTVRSGRGTKDRVTAKDRETIWEVFTKYNQALLAQGKVDFDDYALLTLNIIKEKGNAFDPPFTHLVIDEAQDLNKAQMAVLVKIVSKTTNSITIIADAAQRIYKSGFSWKEVGLNVAGGRTVEFKINYRNPQPIAKAALSLLAKDNDSEEFTSVEVNTTEGDKPVIKKCNSLFEEYAFIAASIQKITRNSPNETVCILHRTNRGVDNAVRQLAGFNINAVKVKTNDNNSSVVKALTMQGVKGLQFDHVIILDLNDDNLPILSGFSEPDDDLHLTTERRLLYTCMTRAMKSLLITYSGKPSRYIAEIDPSLIELQ
ncbi:UvrD-helicase domain-containing protein [Pseudoalteromonas sp. M58]|uniref:UvrD-helicase domain-containing protein n=1 Tax=Pseudoalteromonas sp. M58 TaxID=3141534 RepID=UPI003672AEFC